MPERASPAASPASTDPASLTAAGLAAPRLASVVLGLAPLLWLPQAALLAWAVQRLGAGPGGDVARSVGATLADVLPLAAAFLLLGGLRAGLEAAAARRLYRSARAQLSQLRSQLAQTLGQRSPLDRTRPDSGLAASVIAEQAEAIVPWLVRWRPARWRAVVLPLAILPAVAAVSWVAALVLLCAAPLIPVFMALVGWRARAASQAQMVEMGSMNAFLLDRLRGLATLRALAAVEATAQRVGDAAQSLRQRTLAVLRIAFLSSAVLELFSALGVAMVAAYVGLHLLGAIGFGSWGRRIDLGGGLFVLLLAPAFFEPLRELSAVWHDRAAGEAALAAIARLAEPGLPLPGAQLDASAAAPHGASSPSPPVVPAPPTVQLRGLQLGHPGERVFLDRLVLHIGAGEHLALMGPSGCGKTALLSLVAGLLPATAGSIAIGGVVLSDASAAGLRRRIAWMGQAPHVFAGSVQTNVALGRAGVTPSQVREAMRFAELADVAQAQPGVALGEGGRGLSGGEAVRLALARLALNTEADLWLIDEPTAHLDSETARRVTDALLELARGKTLLVATHDPVLAARMDRVLRLDSLALKEAA